jgi:hypothetical protein
MLQLASTSDSVLVPELHHFVHMSPRNDPQLLNSTFPPNAVSVIFLSRNTVAIAAAVCNGTSSNPLRAHAFLWTPDPLQSVIISRDLGSKVEKSIQTLRGPRQS